MFSARANHIGHLAIAAAVCVLFVLSGVTAMGQSGRRLEKSPAVSVPTPEPKQPEKKTVANDQPLLSLVIGTDRGDVFAGVPSYYYDSVLQSCARRLNDAHVKLEVANHEMTRGDAVKRARAEKDAYVVWLQLRSDSSAGTAGGNLGEIYLEYTVFQPITAKVETRGTCYQGAYRKGGVIVGPRTSGSSNTVIAESRLKDAAEEAAERILKALHIALPSDIPVH